MIKRKVLYIDDREQNLTSFRAALRREFEVYTSPNRDLAFQLIRENEIPVVVADYKMPEMTGVTFLEEVKNNFPDTVRIMLTGHADLPAVVEAINRSEIFRFLAKPWQEDELVSALNAAHQIYETRKELELKNKQLDKAYRELDRLVYSAAHDITNPLSNILGLISLIKMDSGNQEEYLRLIEKSTKKLQFLARDVLSFHKNKRLGVSSEELNITKMINRIVEENKFLTNGSEIHFTLEFDHGGPFESDKVRTQIILNNLISNAVKYQDPLKQDKRISIKSKTDDSGWHLVVEDNGIGIHNEIQPRIFDLYFRASKMSTGTGLGLYIVSEAISILGGNIEVDSQEGKGSRFSTFVPNKS